MLVTLSLPVVITKPCSDIFIFMTRGKPGLKKKNDFVRKELLKKEKAKQQKFSTVRTLEFENLFS
ncbi:MAG TPA: hypothetical protein VI757_00910 [Bacteroidia bacterium]|nr:hypothetical protein [Bacteroidia bacterium]